MATKPVAVYSGNGQAIVMSTVRITYYCGASLPSGSVSDLRARDRRFDNNNNNNNNNVFI